MGYRKKRNLEAVLIHGILIVISFICIFPIAWMCLISVKDTSESLTGFHSLWVQSPTLGNFKRLAELIPIWQNTFNSVFTTIMGTVTSLFFCSLAGFAFAKYKFPGRNFLFYFLIATMLVPVEVGAVPLFVIMKKLELINSLWSLIIPKIATAIGIFYMNQYISEVPDELVEAAKIDGCSDFGIYWRVIIPVIKPALASWGAVTLISRWNDFFLAVAFLKKAGEIHTDCDNLPSADQRRTFNSLAGNFSRNYLGDYSDYCPLFDFGEIPEGGQLCGSSKRMTERESIYG